MAEAIRYIGIARMSGGIEIGETATKALVKSGKAVLVAVASDASAGAKRRAEGYVFETGAPLIVVPYTKERISAMSGRPGCSMAAFRNLGLACSFAKALQEEYGAPYGEAAEQLEAKRLRAGKRGRRKHV